MDSGHGNMHSAVGPSAIRECLQHLPKLPGVYKMLNAAGEPIYIGKANSIFNRVSSYISKTHENNRIATMVSQVAKVETIVTRTEDEALFLEAKLIRSIQPKYNILLKDDKSYPFIGIDYSTQYPRIFVTRASFIRNNPHIKVFGPFATASSANQSLIVIQKICQIRPCRDSFFNMRTRPCIEHQIKRCSAPCVNKITPEEYAKLLDQAVEILSGNVRDVISMLSGIMHKYSDAEDYSRAAIIRDRMLALQKLSQTNTFIIDKSGDYVGLCNELDTCCVQVFRVLNGHHFGNIDYFFEHTEGESDGAILSTFITRHYIIKSMEPPPRIFVGTPVDDKEVLERVLSNKYARRINISVLPEGEGLDFIRTINYNAEQALLNKTTTVSNNSRVMAEVAKVFAIEREINTIEVFDNSHTSGGMPVGAIIVATKYGFIKSQYRIFNIKSADQSDDYSMLREVIERRLHDKTRKNPDLLLIDGGRGHLNAALRVLREHKVDIPCVGIAKGKQRKASKEKFYVPGKRAFSIKDNNAVFRYLQRLRDEAHRFAISSHRRKRIRALPPIDKR